MTAAVVVLALLVLALLLFLLAAFRVVDHPRVHLGWLAAAAATLALIVSSWPE